jgi:general secretion pathway protein G
VESHLIRTEKAFTFVELLIVVLIIGALAVVAIPRIGANAANAKINACKTNIKIINQRMELRMARKGTYPTSWDTFKNNKKHFPDGPPECPFGEDYIIENNRIKPHTH